MLRTQYQDKQWVINADPATHNTIVQGMSAAVLYYFRDTDTPLPVANRDFALGWFTIAKAYYIPCGLRDSHGELFSYDTGFDSSRHTQVAVVFWRNALMTDWHPDDITTALLNGAEVTPEVVQRLPETLSSQSYELLFKGAPYRVKKLLVRWALGHMRPELLADKHVDFNGSPSLPCGQLAESLGSPGYQRSVAALSADNVERLVRLRADLQYVTQELQTIMMTMGVSVYCQITKVLDGEATADTISPQAAGYLSKWLPQLTPPAPPPPVDVSTLNRGELLQHYIHTGDSDAIVANYEARDLISLTLAQQAHGAQRLVPRAVLQSTFIYTVPTPALVLLLAKEAVPELVAELRARIDSRINNTTRTTPQGIVIPVALDVRPEHLSWVQV